MANLTETATWEAGIYQLEQTDLVIGGPGGISNTQGQQLANRTTWLKGQIGVANRLADTAWIDANTTLTAAHAGNAIIANADNKTLTITLPLGSSVPKGTIIPITAINVNKSQVTIRTNSYTVGYPFGITYNDIIQYGGQSRTTMFLGQGDSIWLVKGDPPPPILGGGIIYLTGSYWYAIEVKGNFDDVGEATYSYKVLPNMIEANGQMLNRVDYPRLWEFANSIPGGLPTDAQWLAGTGGQVNAFRGCFSYGNGSTTFRVPDLRAMFLRALDNGRGIDLGRVTTVPGGYEKDEVIAHNHINGSFDRLMRYDNGYNTTSTSADYTAGEPDIYNSAQILPYGGAETRPKNVGLVAQIKA
jgi:hypothetical protein